MMWESPAILVYVSAAARCLDIMCHFYFTAYCTDGEVRLTEGETEWEGRLEVCINGRWGTVGGNEWTQINSHVVCNALGYDITGK